MKLLRSAVAGCAVVMLAGGASAATVVAVGDNVRFTYDDSTAYGTGIVVGDTILFHPDDIRAASQNVGSQTTTKMLNIQVEILTDGYWLQDFKLLEQGDYELYGDGASVDMAGEFMISSNTNSYSVTDNFDAGPLVVHDALTEWTASSMISLADTVGWGSDTDIDIDLSNELFAQTLAGGESAAIQKKLDAVRIEITAVPVPAAVWLFGSGLIGLAGFMRRKAAA